LHERYFKKHNMKIDKYNLKQLREMVNSRYKNDYFAERNTTDNKRIKSFINESKLIKRYVSTGNILDIGCSTGEFYEYLNWNGNIFGVEISEYAASFAKKRGITMSKDIPEKKGYFDAVILRGTIQHLDTPFLTLQMINFVLKPDGYLFILATPNTNCIYYKIWEELPALDSKLNFLIPSDKMLINALYNIDFNFVDIRYPYLNSPYRNLLKDHLKFILKLFGFKYSFPFYRNMMDIIFQKKHR
jgi:SAM-dependent methyltransferase